MTLSSIWEACSISVRESSHAMAVPYILTGNLGHAGDYVDRRTELVAHAG